MSTPRKLTPEQEREVALAYLCSVSVDKIGEKYRVSEETGHSETDLLKTKNCGRKSLKEIKEVLGALHLSLGEKQYQNQG